MLDDLIGCVIPAPEPINTRIPPNLIGEAFQILEFHKIFSSSFGDILFSDSLKKLTLADMETVLFEQTSSGLYCDFIFFFIQVRFTFLLFLFLLFYISFFYFFTFPFFTFLISFFLEIHFLEGSKLLYKM